MLQEPHIFCLWHPSYHPHPREETCQQGSLVFPARYLTRSQEASEVSTTAEEAGGAGPWTRLPGAARSQGGDCPGPPRRPPRRPATPAGERREGGLASGRACL